MSRKDDRPGNKTILCLSILTGTLLILGSLSSTVGYQSLQTSRQTITKGTTTRLTILQTILTLANAEEIQSRTGFPGTSISKPRANVAQLSFLYALGTILVKTIGIARAAQLAQNFLVTHPAILTKVKNVPNLNQTLQVQLSRLSQDACGCSLDDTRFPALCTIMLLIFFGYVFISNFILVEIEQIQESYPIFVSIERIVEIILFPFNLLAIGLLFLAYDLQCPWIYPPDYPHELSVIR